RERITAPADVRDHALVQSRAVCRYDASEQADAGEARRDLARETRMWTAREARDERERPCELVESVDRFGERLLQRVPKRALHVSRDEWVLRAIPRAVSGEHVHVYGDGRRPRRERVRFQ